MNECIKIFWIWFNRSFLFLFLCLMALIAFLDLVSWPWSSRLFFLDSSGLQNLLLFLAFEAAFYYAYVTHEMWQLNKEPVLRIQWNDLGKDDDFQKLKEKDSRLYDTYTDLQLVNIGKGSASDLIITVKYLYSKKSLLEIRNVTAMSPGGKTQLRYKGNDQSNRGRVFNDEYKSYTEPFRIKIDYKDINCENKKIIFEVDENYNDGFKII